MRLETYNGHKIDITSKCTESGRWSATAKFDAKERGRMVFTTMDYGQPHGYKTQEEAEVAAFEFAKEWIHRNLSF